MSHSDDSVRVSTLRDAAEALEGIDPIVMDIMDRLIAEAIAADQGSES